MARVILFFCVVSLCSAVPALAQQQITCTPAAGAALASTTDLLKTLFDATGGKMEVRPEDDALVLTGLVELPVPCQPGTRISADLIEIFFERALLIASGNVVFADPEGRIAAERVEFNLSQGTGTFHQASGIMSLGPTVNRAEFGGQDPDVYFWGELIEKLSADKYRISNGGFTTCVQPEPRWAIGSESVVINRNEYAMARNMVLRVKGVPLMYLPVVYYPIQSDERATGFLMPTYGTSTLRGGSLSNAFFWAINRSQDATLFHDWYTRVGQGAGAEYRYVGAASAGNMRFYRFGQQETRFAQNGATTVLPAQISYLVNSAVSQDIGRLRAQGRVEYFTDVQTGQLYFRDAYQQSQSRRLIDGGMGGSFGPATIGAYYSRSEVFTDARTSTVTGSLPRATASITPSRLFGTPVYAGVTSDYSYIANQQLRDGVVQADTSMNRIDVAPSLRAPLSRLTYLSAITTAAYRTTYYSRSLDESSRLGFNPITRQFLSLQTQVVGPVLNKIWDTPNSTFSARKKHVIEPTFSVDYVTDITNQARVPVVDSTGVAVGGAMRLTYGVTNRLLARKPDEGAARGVTREFLTVGVQQTYYTDTETSRYDSTYASYAIRPRPVDLSPVAVTARVSPVDPINATARMEYDLNGNGLQILTVGSTLTSGVNTANMSFSWQRPTPLSPISSYVSGSTGLKFVQGRVSTSYSANWDIDARFIQSQSLGMTYFAQCCGVQADFQTVNFPRTGGFPIPSDRRFNFSLVLAGVGTFSNFFGAFGGQP